MTETVYKSVDWTRGPIGPGWFMLFAPIAVDGVGSVLGSSPQYRPQPWEKVKPVTKPKTSKEEDFAFALLMLMDD